MSGTSQPIGGRAGQSILAVLATFVVAAAWGGNEGPSDERTAELIRMVRQDCGSCHGLTLRGGLGPALLPETLADKPVDSLVATVLAGRPGTPMPPWRPFLSEVEARWIVLRLRDGFPQEAAR